jgi:ABC-type transport system involved in multi-copper enzyme maturation permease subunit
MVAGIISFFGPIISIALSFDTIVKEKIQNSISLLICRPVSKRSIATGKFLGIVLALCIPVTIVTYLAVLIISVQSGKGIEFGQAGGFIFFTLLFLIIYAAIGQLISSITKTTTTAILMGIVIWIFLLVIGGVIGYFVPDFSDQISLINPSTPYGVTISHALGTLEEASVEVISLGGYYLTFVIWLVFPIFLAIELFNRIEN